MTKNKRSKTLSDNRSGYPWKGSTGDDRFVIDVWLRYQLKIEGCESDCDRCGKLPALNDEHNHLVTFRGGQFRYVCRDCAIELLTKLVKGEIK